MDATKQSDRHAGSCGFGTLPSNGSHSEPQALAPPAVKEAKGVPETDFGQRAPARSAVNFLPPSSVKQANVQEEMLPCRPPP